MRATIILCREKLAHRTGWLLAAGLEEAQPSGPTAFLVAIVLAPTDLFPLEPGSFEVSLTKHTNPVEQGILNGACK